jgi:hypothetical protein
LEASLAFNGSGVHNRVHDWTQDLSNTIPVTASRMDAEHDDISAALSNTICRDLSENLWYVTMMVLGFYYVHWTVGRLKR